MEFTPDGERLVIRREGAAQVLETRTGKPIGAVIKSTPELRVDEVALSRDGLFLATAAIRRAGRATAARLGYGKWRPVNP